MKRGNTESSGPGPGSAGMQRGARGSSLPGQNRFYSPKRNTCGSSSPLQFVLLRYLPALRVFSVRGVNFGTSPIGGRCLMFAGFSRLLVLTGFSLLVFFPRGIVAYENLQALNETSAPQPPYHFKARLQTGCEGHWVLSYG